jgi:hypothetical protein
LKETVSHIMLFRGSALMMSLLLVLATFAGCCLQTSHSLEPVQSFLRPFEETKTADHKKLKQQQNRALQKQAVVECSTAEECSGRSADERLSFDTSLTDLRNVLSDAQSMLTDLTESLSIETQPNIMGGLWNAISTGETMLEELQSGEVFTMDDATAFLSFGAAESAQTQVNNVLESIKKSLESSDPAVTAQLARELNLAQVLPNLMMDAVAACTKLRKGLESTFDSLTANVPSDDSVEANTLITLALIVSTIVIGLVFILATAVITVFVVAVILGLIFLVSVPILTVVGFSVYTFLLLFEVVFIENFVARVLAAIREFLNSILLPPEDQEGILAVILAALSSIPGVDRLVMFLINLLDRFPVPGGGGSTTTSPTASPGVSGGITDTLDEDEAVQQDLMLEMPARWRRRLLVVAWTVFRATVGRRPVREGLPDGLLDRLNREKEDMTDELASALQVDIDSTYSTTSVDCRLELLSCEMKNQLAR